MADPLIAYEPSAKEHYHHYHKNAGQSTLWGWLGSETKGAFSSLARNLEKYHTARFTIYANDVTIWTESKKYSSSDAIQTALQAAAESIEKNLSTPFAAN